jgi:hypothetical protein
MSEWTKAAKQEWENYCQRVRASLGGDPANADEVIDDLRRHVEEEIAATQLKVVTEEDVRRITRKLGEPEREERPSSAAPLTPTTGDAPPKQVGWFVSSLVLFAGVLLPLFTLGFELVTASCSSTFFDPIPTPFHVLLVALVPAINFWTWRALRRSEARHLSNLGWLNAVVLGITVFYTLQFLPMLPWGFIGIIFMGFGLLPIAPFLSFITTLVLRVKLNTFAGAVKTPLAGFWRGFGLAALLLFALGAQTWATRLGLTWSASEDGADRARGVRWLRAFGSEEVLRRECYGRTARAANMDFFDLMLSGRNVTADEARLLYYRVTGRSFNTMPAPKVRTPRGAFAELDNWTWDADQGGDVVGGRIKGLTLHGSRLDAVIEPDAAYAYSEWTLEFKNTAASAHEARAQVLLPPGGVVSRLTLWVNGEEREAAFGGRSQVKEAYKSVAIRQRRDPVLVSTCGPDRVLVQCFPVPPNGGTIKVRMGITSPLLLAEKLEGVFRWPCFIERNFSIPDERRHSVWATSSRPMSSRGTLTSNAGGGSPYALHGELRESELASAESLIRVARTNSAEVATAKDSRGATSAVIRQTIEVQATAPPGRAVLVLDRSPEMAGLQLELARAIESLPKGIEWGVLLAGDEPQWLYRSGDAAHGLLADAAHTIRRLDCVGGHDNTAALVTAFDWASAKPQSAIIWIHASQPVELSSPESLRQRLERDTQGTHILCLQARVGPNRILEQLDGLTSVTSAPRFGAFADDLKQSLLACQQGTALPALRRERTEFAAASDSGDIANGSLHLARLWAKDEVRRLMTGRQTKEAVALAARYQLVTPVTAAVVLETQQQFQQHGLQPVDPDTVPSIPEPSAFSLLLLGGALLRWLAGKKRRAHV